MVKAKKIKRGNFVIHIIKVISSHKLQKQRTKHQTSQQIIIFTIKATDKENCLKRYFVNHNCDVQIKQERLTKHVCEINLVYHVKMYNGKTQATNMRPISQQKQRIHNPI